MSAEPHPASFRDPKAHICCHDGRILRMLTDEYLPDYRQLMDSGLYDALQEKQWLISHHELSANDAPEGVDAALVLEHPVIPLITYPYEWCFSQLKEAAILTLKIQQLAMRCDMELKDASAFNLQWQEGRWLHIDTASFTRYKEGAPWVAYQQFCRHFLAPLLLMAYGDLRANALMRVHLDGIPLELASTLLPYKTRLKPAILMHIHWHARSLQSAMQGGAGKRDHQVPKARLEKLIDHLTLTVQGLSLAKTLTRWGDYYTDTNYSDAARLHKEQLVQQWVAEMAPSTLWDLGANTGHYSKIAQGQGAKVVAVDEDPLAVERLYHTLGRGNDALQCLRIDLTNPSPALGWAHKERASLQQRCNADMCMALALIHHLTIGCNIPFSHVAGWFSRLAPTLLIEFVDKADSQIQEMLQHREDVFSDYNLASFRTAFGEYYDIVRDEPITDSQRRLLLMRRREA